MHSHASTTFVLTDLFFPSQLHFTPAPRRQGDDVEANYWDDDDHFDEDAKNKAVAAVSKKTTSFLLHEPVFKVIRDFVDKENN